MNYWKKWAVRSIEAVSAAVRYFSPRSCRFEPSCSCYAKQAYVRFGFWRASRTALWRFFRCHPLSAGGYDPLAQISEKGR